MVMEELDSLYREVILEHFKHSKHAGRLSSPTLTATGQNPLCGDEMVFDLAVDGGRISAVRFDGKGCVISQAAASMLSQQLEGKTPEQARTLVNAMKAMMQGTDPDPTVDVGDLEALSGVRKFPVRVKCAALSWNVVEQALEGYAREVKRQK